MNIKKMSAISAFFVLSVLILSGWAFNPTGTGAAFTSPAPGALIEDRGDFPASLQIDDFDKSGHYWVAIATVTDHDSTWDRVLELFEKRRNKPNADREEMERLLGLWQIDQFWPKFYIPESPYERNVHDGGRNPMEGLEPQPMILLLLKVDTRLHQHFRQWFREGPQRGYPGIKASMLSTGMVIARSEIFFP